jgi:ATP phosphoribosyltransferase regulatory subunit HisZ
MRKPKLPRSFARHIPASGFGLNLRGFAAGLLVLQEKRLSADYDPLMRYRKADAIAAVGEAQSALTQFKNTSDAEREAFLALLVFKPR